MIKRFWIALFLVALCSRLLIWAAFQSRSTILGPFAQGSVATDFSGDFWGVAHNIAAGKGFSVNQAGWLTDGNYPTAFFAPGQPFIYAALLLLSPEKAYLLAKGLQAVLISFALVFFTMYFERIWGRSVALAAFVFMNLSPFLGVAHLQFIDNSSTSFLAGAVLLAFQGAAEAPKTGRAILLGTIFGLLLLFNPSFGLVGLVALVWLRMTKKYPWQQAWIVIVVCASVLMPWTVRNYVRFGKLIPIRSAYGAILWAGNNPRATGGVMDENGVRLDPEPEVLAQYQQPDELKSLADLQRRAFLFIRENPARFLQLRWNAWLYYWIPQVYWLNKPLSDARKILFALTVAMVSLTFAGMAMTLWDRAPHAGFLVLGTLAFAAVYGLSCSDISDRYRLTLDPLHLAFAAYFLMRITGHLRLPNAGEKRAAA